MNISAIIRKIQRTDNLDKKSVVASVFDELQKMYPSKAEILQTVKEAVCDNIDGPANFVPFYISSDSDYELMNKFLAKFGLNLVKGESGSLYISWSKQLAEENEDELKRILHDLHDVDDHNLLYEVFKIFEIAYPEKQLQLVFGDEFKAKKNALYLNKQAYCIYDGAVYLLAE